jgi:TRAP-type mannitol/chloroaromatic compound transport system permease small subunit
MWLANVIDRFTGAVALAVSLIVIPLVLAMVYEVVSRYVFAAPTYWAFEVSYMMMGTIFLFGIAYALQIGQHVSVDFINFAISDGVRRTIRVVSHILLLAMVTWLTYALYQYVDSAYRSGEGSGVSAWNPTIWPYRVAYLAGFALFALQIVSEIIKDLTVFMGAQSGENA